MSTPRGEHQPSDMELRAHSFSDDVVGRALLMPGDTVQLHLDVQQRTTSFGSYKQVVGSEEFQPDVILTTWEELRAAHHEVAESCAILDRGGNAINQAHTQVTEFQEQAEGGREVSIGVLMNNMWKHIDNYASDITTSLQAITAAGVIARLKSAHEKWVNTGYLDDLRSVARESETVFIVAPDLSERVAENAGTMAGKAVRDRRDLQILLRKSN